MKLQTPYNHLLKPLNLGSITLKNRIIMGSMHTGLEEQKNGYKKLAAFYAKRAKENVALIITGGVSPNIKGGLFPFATTLRYFWQVKKHQLITQAVHKHGGLICMQILHAGRYAYHPFNVAPSAIKSTINPFKPKKLSNKQILNTINDFVTSACLAQKAGYDGVEIMASEGYLINQFFCIKSNKRNDNWGGSLENRARLAVQIVQKTREKTGKRFIIIYRLSMLDLVSNGAMWSEVVYLAKAIEQAGATIINTGIGWHEARIPTIASSVPRAAFTWITQKMKTEVSIPLITSNRINAPDVAEAVLAQGHADLVSMARPFLADPLFVTKTINNQPELINTCIACNQACLDHVFAKKRATCLVNPQACYETELVIKPTQQCKKIAVVGAGPAGLAFACYAAKKGHHVSLYEQQKTIGGQFNYAKQIPGKEEFYETLRYFENRLKALNVTVFLNTQLTVKTLQNNHFDEVVIATGVLATQPKIVGINHPKVVTYADVLSKKIVMGKRVAIIGAGGIGFDVAAFLVGQNRPLDNWLKHWGVDKHYKNAGALTKPVQNIPKRTVFLLQRKVSKMGKNLAKTTGWIHRAELKNNNVTMLSGVQYTKIDNDGLHITVNNEEKTLNVDHIVICAGQQSEKTLWHELQKLNVSAHLIGGAKVASEVDAKRAIREALELALAI